MDEAAVATERRNKLVINLILVSSFVVILNETMMSNATPPLMRSLGVSAGSCCRWPWASR
jgi:DHA2 family lincomycin resistance protein-like MFS transporter